ncbi:hypothetical protein F4776DRAFT_612248 [Hypoxylon sp. NC0597]|nr:hypothetical protein F4776DRAFT_612248 [Hypoxylon sp. NC0597]
MSILILCIPCPIHPRLAATFLPDQGEEHQHGFTCGIFEISTVNNGVTFRLDLGSHGICRTFRGFIVGHHGFFFSNLHRFRLTKLDHKMDDPRAFRNNGLSSVDCSLWVARAAKKKN